MMLITTVALIHPRPLSMCLGKRQMARYSNALALQGALVVHSCILYPRNTFVSRGKNKSKEGLDQK